MIEEDWTLSVINTRALDSCFPIPRHLMGRCGLQSGTCADAKVVQYAHIELMFENHSHSSKGRNELQAITVRHNITHKTQERPPSASLHTQS